MLLDGERCCSTLEPDEGDPVKHQIPPGLLKLIVDLVLWQGATLWGSS